MEPISLFHLHLTSFNALWDTHISNVLVFLEYIQRFNSKIGPERLAKVINSGA